ncbi:hypothetical protein SUGI_0555280 [Cryptomeria japonica]|nr:hypothetical protein SUGI_0555280 [Cryptomeria japonica]
MGLVKLKNVFGWICGLKAEFSNGSTLKLELLELSSGKKITLCAEFIGKHVYLGLWLESVGFGESVPLGELGTCLIEECSKKQMRQNLLPLFSRLCIYAFLGVTHKDIVDLKIRGRKKEKISQEEIDGLLRLEIEPDTIEPGVYKPAFNTLFYAVSYSCLIHRIQQADEIEYHKVKLKELGAEILQEIGPEATESLMKSLVSKYTRILSDYEGGKVDELKISYTSSLDNSWGIHCYCPRLEMEREIYDGDASEPLEYALSHQLLQCMLRLDNVVNIQADCIKVELKIGHLHCKALQLDPYRSLPRKLQKEWYFPAKIRLTMGPECKSGVHDLSLGAPSQNPSASISKAKTNEIALQVQVGSGMPLLNVGFKDARTTSSTHTRKNWHCDRSKPRATQGRLEWTLYDNFYGKSVFNYEPCCTKLYKAIKTFAEAVGSDIPFTQDGGIIFEGDMCETPMTWWLKGDLDGKTLKWFVEVEIWLAYYPNEYRTEYMEIRYQKFRERVDLSLVSSVKDSLPQPTSMQLVQDTAPQPTTMHLVQDSLPQPTSMQLVQDTAPHPTELQVLLNWVFVICILCYFYTCVFG